MKQIKKHANVGFVWRERRGKERERENTKGDEKDLYKNLIKNMLYGKFLN